MKNILMNTEMTKAILDGRKVQTRRIVPFKIYLNDDNNIVAYSDKKNQISVKGTVKNVIRKSKYKIGDFMWVREPAKVEMCFTEEFYFRYMSDEDEDKLFTLPIPKRFIKDGFVVNWMAHCNGVPNGCIKEMARTFLKITDVRVESLQDITLEDIDNEGAPMNVKRAEDIGEPDFCYEWWIDTWDETAQKGYKWEDNPYVFVYEFEREKFKRSLRDELIGNK